MKVPHAFAASLWTVRLFCERDAVRPRVCAGCHTARLEGRVPRQRKCFDGSNQEEKITRYTIRRRRSNPSGPQGEAWKGGMDCVAALAMMWACFRDLAACFTRGFAISLPSTWKRAQGRPGACRTRGLACQCTWQKRTRAYRFGGSIPAFPAQWLYGLLRALPGERLFCLRRLRFWSQA